MPERSTVRRAPGEALPPAYAVDDHARRHFAGQIGDIEVLRGIAISMVLVEHMPVNLLWWKGRFFNLIFYQWHGARGVDLFFAISGFVIARGLLPQLQAARARRRIIAVLLRFWLRRVFRLLPAAWLWLAIPLYLSWQLGIFSTFGTFSRNLTTVGAALLNVENFQFALGRRDWGGPAMVYWSLSLEEQFYILLPLVALVARRWLPMVLGAAVIYQFVVPFSPLTDMTKPGALAVGVLLAIAQRHTWFAHLEPRFLGRSGIAKWLFLAVMIAIMGRLGVHSTSWKLGIIALLSGLLVGAAAYDRNYMTPGITSGRLLRWLGSRSYALYLTHMTAFLGTHWIVILIYGYYPPHDAWLDMLAIGCAMTIAALLAELTHRIVEIPARNVGRRLTARNPVAVTAG